MQTPTADIFDFGKADTGFRERLPVPLRTLPPQARVRA